MKIHQNTPLAPYTTLRIGGPARYFVTIADETDLREAITYARDHNLPTFALGSGSNLLVSDDGYPGMVLHFSSAPSIKAAQDGSSTLLEVSAGTSWDHLVLYCCEQSLPGMECLAGIPGLVGASPIQNIGAYGQEVAQTITSVRALDRQTGFFTELSHADCGFAYRRSIFNSTHSGRYVITSVRFRLKHHDKPNLTYPDLRRYFEGHPNSTPLEVYHAVRQIRAAKGMLIDPANPTPDSTSAGSFFKNPVVSLATLDRIATHLGIPIEQIQHWPVAAHPEAADLGGTVPQQESGKTKLPAAWLIERAGFPKGYRLGPVGISTRHTLALTNRTGTATCADLLALRDRIIANVQDDFGITLEQEPVYLS